MQDGRLVLTGTSSSTVTPRVPIVATLIKPVRTASSQGGTRPSAALVICDRDMTVNTDDAVLQCTAQVTDASGQPGSRAPTASVGWSTEVGTIDPSSCTLVGGGGSTGWCAVTLRTRAADIPIGIAPPVTDDYPGDTLFAPSGGSPKLYGRASGFRAQSDIYGPTCNPATTPKPNVGCGDPVNPATGNLSMSGVDLALGGRGPGLAVSRTYNALAAVAGDAGRFGAGWMDQYGARLESGPGQRVTIVLGTGATVPFTATGKK
ncbi:MAG: DUF6531 domain-containing protein, partial [Chloroflexi bacterium]|nr:DUF6531 domain-containing protein [Chloroflexota bacterium]